MSAIAVAAVAVAGVGIAGAAGAFTPDSPSAPNVGQQTADQINAQIAATPANYKAQAEYNPKFAALNSTIAWQNLFGTPATQATTSTKHDAGWYDSSGNLMSTTRSAYQAAWPGQGYNSPGYGSYNLRGYDSAAANKDANPNGYVWKDAWTESGTQSVPGAPGQLDLAAAAQPRLLAMQTAARANDIGDVQSLAPAAMAAMRSYNPAVTGLYDSMDQQATALVNTNGALDPFIQHSLQQNYRSGEASRGLAGGTGDAAMEAYYQAATQEQRRLQNLSMAGTVAGQTAGYYGDPFQQVLSRTSGGIQPQQVPTSTNQPSAVQNTANLLNSSLTAEQAQGYGYQNQAAIAGYNSQMQSISGLLQPNAQGQSGLSSGLTALKSLGKFF